MKHTRRGNHPTPRDAVALSRKFAAQDDGSMTIFACFMIVIMMMVCGIGVDLMRHEMERTRLQAVSDRAVLAAADLDQTLDPEAVVRDYFAKTGLSQYVSAVNVDEGLNYRTVTVDASTPMKTQFMNALGVDTLTVPARAQAEEKVAKVEISMVLDISGSMGSNNKIQNMRNAAKIFVDTVVRDETRDLISVNIVPYSAHVNAGPEIFARMGVKPLHNFSHCVEFPDSHFDHAYLDSNPDSYTHMQHFQNHDPGWNQRSETVCPRYGDPQNATNESFEAITAFSQNRSALKSQINKLEPRANTSIFLGMKWGTALLDPSFRAINRSMADAGLSDPIFGARPASYDDNETLKTVILMTDGQNVATSRIPYWYYNSDSEIVHWYKYNLGWYLNNYVNRDYHGNFRYTKYTASKGDLLLSNICDAAKNARIVVWSIGFEVTNHGADVMRDCASSPSHFFRVEGVEIEDAFEAIARQINQLRLTQ